MGPVSGVTGVTEGVTRGGLPSQVSAGREDEFFSKGLSHVQGGSQLNLVFPAACKTRCPPTKETIYKTKRQPTQWEKTFANDMSDKMLISKNIYIKTTLIARHQKN